MSISFTLTPSAFIRAWAFVFVPLVATVAGLGVAIPALFGYNYLASKTKNISSEMRVFADEFVTKLAENYSG